MKKISLLGAIILLLICNITVKAESTVFSTTYKNAFITNFDENGKINAKYKEPVNIEGMAETSSKNNINVSVNLNYKIPRLFEISQDNENIIMDFTNPFNKNMYNETVAIATYDESSIVYHRVNSGIIANDSLVSLGLTDTKILSLFEDGETINQIAQKKFKHSKLSDLTKSSEWADIKDEDKTKILELWKGGHALSYKVAKDSIIYLNACRSYRRKNFTEIPNAIQWSPRSMHLNSEWQKASAITEANNIIEITNDESANAQAKTINSLENIPAINSGWSAEVQHGCLLAIKVKDSFNQSFEVKLDQDDLKIDLEVEVANKDAEGVIKQAELDKAKATIPFMIESKGLTFKFDDFENKTSNNNSRFLDLNQVTSILTAEVYNILDGEEQKIADITFPAGKFLDYELTVNQPGTYNIKFFGAVDKDNNKTVIPALSGFTLNIPWIDLDTMNMALLSQTNYVEAEGVPFDYSSLKDEEAVTKLRTHYGLETAYELKGLTTIEDKNFVPPLNSEGFTDNSFTRYKFPKSNLKYQTDTEQHLAFYFYNKVTITEETDNAGEDTEATTEKRDVSIIITAGQELTIDKNNNITVKTAPDKFINVAHEDIIIEANSPTGSFKTNDCKNTNSQCDAKNFVVEYPLMPIDTTYMADVFYYTISKKQDTADSLSIMSLPLQPLALSQTYPKLSTQLNSSFNPPVAPIGQRSGDPIIHVYPTKEQLTNIKVFPQIFTYTNNNYSIVNGWQFLAKPNGELINLSNQQNTNYLEWEGNFLSEYVSDNSGFVIKKDQTELFLTEKLTFLGLNLEEIKNFISKLEPNLPNSNYILFHFVDNNYINKQAPLVINPKPDSLIRVYLQYKGFDQKISIDEQTLLPNERKGYIVVEYGFLQ